MYCKHCGFLVTGDSTTCINCKKNILVGKSFCQRCGKKVLRMHNSCRRCGGNLYLSGDVTSNLSKKKDIIYKVEKLLFLISIFLLMVAIVYFIFCVLADDGFEKKNLLMYGIRFTLYSALCWFFSKIILFGDIK